MADDDRYSGYLKDAVYKSKAPQFSLREMH